MRHRHVTAGPASRMLADAAPEPYWLDRPERPAARSRLVEAVEADLVVVGGGFTGLWAAVQAAEERPDRSVVLLEADRIADGASGRNGGFCAASLTHGLANGLERFADELPTLLRMGRDTLDAIEAAVTRHGIDCDFERSGELDVAVADWQVADLAEEHALARRQGLDWRLLDREQTQAEVASPTYLAAIDDPHGVALVDPARLAWGLAATAERLGVRVVEHSPATGLRRDGAGVVVTTPHGQVRAARALLATAAGPPVRRSIGAYVVPVWDYALMTEPLAPDVRAALGWARRQGIGDAGNRFHYYRLAGSSPGGDDPPNPPHKRRGNACSSAVTTRSISSAGTPTRDGHSILRHSRSWRSTWSTLSRSWPTCGSATRGAGRSTPAAGSAHSGTGCWAGGRFTSAASPGSASEPRTSAPRPRWTCSTAPTPNGPGWPWCGQSPSRSRPSRCAGPASS